MDMLRIRDVLYKRNVFGYEEETRLQLYVTHVRQIPMYVVYPVQNESDYDPLDVEEYGYWFLNAENVVKFVKDYIGAWQRNSDAIPSVDLCREVIDSLNKPFEFDEHMYRVVFRDPIGDIPVSAMGSMPYDEHHPWFVSADAKEVAKYNIYTGPVAQVVARLNSLVGHHGYVHDRVRMACDGAHFAVEYAPYHPSGVPQDGDKWMEFETYPAWNRKISLNFTDDIMELRYDYELRTGSKFSTKATHLEALMYLERQERVN